MSTRYAFDLEETHWVRVPLSFPDESAPDVFAWAAGLADALAGADAVLHRAIIGRATEIAAMPGPRAGADERLWLLPSDVDAEVVAHLYFADAAGESTDDYAVAGVDGIVQSWRAVERTGFDDALAVEIIAQTDSQPLFVSRRLGRIGDAVAVLEVIDLTLSGAMLEDGPLDELLRGLVVETG
ncbi:hypothetical protein SAMN04487783_0741 [Agrococcus baldri]|uniref:Uncharacterized protein n=1 Tax=Agrococcus baldri TaxID=153730 RepID=A0AA94HLW4_9MICO|nr:hypothetical protein [Agrococcus baldri]SFS03370.1 hypothetical protein SAMN04487783_0741 [Agrococcus baldri]